MPFSCYFLWAVGILHGRLSFSRLWELCWRERSESLKLKKIIIIITEQKKKKKAINVICAFFLAIQTNLLLIITELTVSGYLWALWLYKVYPPRSEETADLEVQHFRILGKLFFWVNSFFLFLVLMKSNNWKQKNALHRTFLCPRKQHTSDVRGTLRFTSCKALSFWLDP